MKPKPFWLYEFYCWLFVFSILRQTFSFFWPNSPTYFYHYFLRHYNWLFQVTYYIDVIHLVLDWTACWAVLRYVYGKKCWDGDIWKILLALRILVSFKNYEFYHNQLVSLYYSSPKLCTSIVIIQILLILPSYFITYWYAVPRKKATHRSFGQDYDEKTSKRSHRKPRKGKESQ